MYRGIIKGSRPESQQKDHEIFKSAATLKSHNIYGFVIRATKNRHKGKHRKQKKKYNSNNVGHELLKFSIFKLII